MSYKPRLDGLRSIAIFMVLLEHFAYYIGNAVSAGFYGVNLFFVLSGFLITGILLNNPDKNFGYIYKRFIARRALRIFPIYYLVLLVLYLLGVAGIKRDIFFLATYTYNYKLILTQDWSSIYTLYWSLSVEEQFYLFFPFIAILLRRQLKILLPVVGIVIIMAYLQVYFNFLFPYRFNYTHLISNMSALGMGAMGAVLFKTGKTKVHLFSNVVYEYLALLLLFFSFISFSWQVKWLLFPLVNLFFVIKCAGTGFSLSFADKYLNSTSAIKVGKISYGIYLYHMIVAFYLSKYIFDPLWSKSSFTNWGLFSKLQFNAWILKFPVYSLISIWVASVSFRYIESPVLLLKDKYFKN